MLVALLDNMAPTLRLSTNMHRQNTTCRSAMRMSAIPTQLGETKALISTGMCSPESDIQEDKENFQPGIAERIKQSRRAATKMHTAAKQLQPGPTRIDTVLNTQEASRTIPDSMSSNCHAPILHGFLKRRRSSNTDQPAPYKRPQQLDGTQSPINRGLSESRDDLNAEYHREPRQPSPPQATATQVDAISGLVQFSHVQNPLYAPNFIASPLYEVGPIIEHVVPRTDVRTAAQILLHKDHSNPLTSSAPHISSAVTNNLSLVEPQSQDTTPATDLAGQLAAADEPEDTTEEDFPQLPDEEASTSVALDLTDEQFVEKMKIQLTAQSKWKTKNAGRAQAKRIFDLLDLATAPSPAEALVISSEEAAKQLQANAFFPGPIFVEGAQPMELDTIERFLGEYYDDSAKVSIQDPAMKRLPHTREVTVGQLKAHFRSGSWPKTPWNCLELAAHVEDGIRPAFLNSEDCRLITKLKHPRTGAEVSRRGFEAGYKEIEKWALLAQAGSLTEPHQDSHGYSTFITINQGAMGFGWLANPTPAQRKQWTKSPNTFTEGDWRYKIVREGQTVYFPNGTVHFVFRLRAAGDTLAFGGHVLRCSQIVSWVKTLLEEQANPPVTNEALTVSAPAYLERVAHFVRQARRMGQEEKWGGAPAIQEFLRLKDEFMEGK